MAQIKASGDKADEPLSEPLNEPLNVSQGREARIAVPKKTDGGFIKS